MIAAWDVPKAAAIRRNRADGTQRTTGILGSARQFATGNFRHLVKRLRRSGRAVGKPFPGAIRYPGMDLSITLHEPARRAELFGPGDRHLRKIRESLGVRIQTRNSTLRLHGEPAAVSRAASVFERLQEMLKGREFLDDRLVEDLIGESAAADSPVAEDAITVFNREATVSPMTDGQRVYLRALAHSDLVFCLGPAGPASSRDSWA